MPKVMDAGECFSDAPSLHRGLQTRVLNSERRTGPPQGPARHPARSSPAILAAIAAYLEPLPSTVRVMDPFAGARPRRVL